jgi:hypothetical protein
MYETLKEARNAIPKHVGLAGKSRFSFRGISLKTALPVPYRTTPEKPTMQKLCAHDSMYLELEPHTLTRVRRV